eukprot:gene16251-biopygen11284
MRETRSERHEAKSEQGNRKKTRIKRTANSGKAGSEQWGSEKRTGDTKSKQEIAGSRRGTANEKPKKTAPEADEQRKAGAGSQNNRFTRRAATAKLRLR